MLSEWVDMLEKELGLKEDKMYCVIDGRISLKGKKEIPGNYSNYKKLSPQYAELTVFFYDKDKLIEKLNNEIRKHEARDSKLQRSITSLKRKVRELRSKTNEISKGLKEQKGKNTKGIKKSVKELDSQVSRLEVMIALWV